MRTLLLATLPLLLTTPLLAQSGPAYTQPTAPNGGILRPSQMWIDPTGQNDLDSDAQAWEDFQLTQTTSITTIRWWGDAAPALGFEIQFWNQDPNTIAVQPDLFTGPFSHHVYTSFTQTPITATLYQFDLQLAAPVTFQANTRYFISILGQQPIAFAYWNWASSLTGPNGTFWWQRGLHMYFHLGESRAVALASAAGWSAGDAFCFGDGTTTACPCANPSVGSARGCNNSFSTGGAILSGTGTPSLSSDSLTLFSNNQSPTATSILLQGTATLPAAATFGQGLRCIGGSLKRLYIRTAVNGSVSAPHTGEPSISAVSTSLGDPIAPNQHRYYTAYYRDPTVLGGCPATSTFNSSNALDILWQP